MKKKTRQCFLLSGVQQAYAALRRNLVWDFSAVFRNRADRSVFVFGVVWRTDRHLECDELSDSDQRLQRDSCYHFLQRSLVHFWSGASIVLIWDFPCGSVDGCGMHWIWDHAFMGCCRCCTVIFRKVRSVHSSFYGG